MISRACGVCSLLLGILCREVSAAGEAAALQNSKDLPYWSIILISLACIMVMAILLCLIYTMCALARPNLYPQHHWVRSYFPHLAFWGFDAEPNENVQ